MQFNVKHIISIVVLMGCFGTGFAGQYRGSAIDRKYNQINNEYINLSSREVAAQEKPTLSRKFGEFFDTDKNMQKIKKINLEGTSETTLEVTGLEEAIAADFVQKQNALAGQHAQCLPKQIGCGVVMVGGCVLAVVMVSQKRPGHAEVIAGGLGALLAVGGAAGLYALSGEKARIENHSAQVKIMQKQWDTFFKIPANS